MLHPALLVGRRHADVQLIVVRQDDDAARAVVREALANGQKPRPFDVESSQRFDVDVLRRCTADVAAAAGVSVAQVEDVNAARVRHDHAVVTAAVHVDDTLGAQTGEVSGRPLLLAASAAAAPAAG